MLRRLLADSIVTNGTEWLSVGRLAVPVVMSSRKTSFEYQQGWFYVSYVDLAKHISEYFMTHQAMMNKSNVSIKMLNQKSMQKPSQDEWWASMLWKRIT